MKEQGANYIIYGVKSTLVFTIMRRGVGAGHPHNHPMSDGECSRGCVVELTVVVALNNFDGAAKLCGDTDKKLTR
jgi:hypothetical protein